MKCIGKRPGESSRHIERITHHIIHTLLVQIAQRNGGHWHFGRHSDFAKSFGQGVVDGNRFLPITPNEKQRCCLRILQKQIDHIHAIFVCILQIIE